MSDTSIAMAIGESRQAMIRVWLAISAIWVAFWLCIAALIATAGAAAVPFTSELPLFALIVMFPPLVLLALGALSRLAFEALFRRPGRR